MRIQLFEIWQQTPTQLKRQQQIFLNDFMFFLDF